MAGLVQTTYANSLFEVALESNILDTVCVELREIKEILADNQGYLKLFASPVIETDVKHSLLKETFEQQISIQTLNFLLLLSDNGRFLLLLEIIDEVLRLQDAHNGIIEITVVTATPLNDGLKQKLINKLSQSTGKTVRLNTKVDISILGGIKLLYNNNELDATVLSRLNEMKQNIKQIMV